jgi:hypothetical protein
MSGRSLIPRLAVLLLFFSLAAATLPRLIALAETARSMMPLTYEARRERQMGPWYASIEALQKSLPKKDAVALIAAPRDNDAAVFASYYLYPVRTRIFSSRDDYRNATPDPTRPKTIVVVTSQRLERTTYDELRDRDLRSAPRVVHAPKLSEPSRTFNLPMAASLEGAAPETFVIEATFANRNPSAANVRATFWPTGTQRMITIPAGATMSYYDFVHQLFGITDRGWMSIESTQPLRAAFYLANRGRREATLLPEVTPGATNIRPAPLYRDTKLFLLNPNDVPTDTVVGSETIPLHPHAFVVKSSVTLPTVRGNVYAFATTRELNGRTDFLWPQ